jgi:hypothetical protein
MQRLAHLVAEVAEVVFLVFADQMHSYVLKEAGKATHGATGGLAMPVAQKTTQLPMEEISISTGNQGYIVQCVYTQTAGDTVNFLYLIPAALTIYAEAGYNKLMKTAQAV